MALSAREVLIILRAQDLASKDIAKIGLAFTEMDAAAREAAMSHIQEGAALMSIGTAFGVAGAAGLKFYGDSLKAAVDYNKEVAYTATQVQDGAQHLKELGDIGVNVAKEIPAPFKEMQASLYDIFSSMDVTIPQSQTLLEAFAKSAVAGQTDVQTAGRATISVMNAFKIPISDVNHVMDVQFETVKLGVITYDQLATTIGRAIPSAVRAGQSFEDLGGMIAFMTRNGLSAAQAATSAARALDMLSNPVFKDNMDAFGVSVTNADGAFRPMVDIVTDLKNKFGDLAPAQKTLEFLRLGGEGSADALKELGINAYDATGALRPFNDVSAELTQHFKGMSEADVSQALADITHGAGGTIQAMRFLNLAVSDTGNMYQDLTNQIRNSGGAAEAAYQIMRATPAMQVQLLHNQWDIIKKDIGDGLIPIFDAFIGRVNDLAHWFLNLDNGTKDLIGKIGLFVSAWSLLTGIILGVAGAVEMMVGLMSLLGVSFLAVSGWVVVAGALSAAILYAATQTQFFQSVLKELSDFLHTYLIPAFNLISDAFKSGGWEAALLEAGHLIENIFLPLVEQGINNVLTYLQVNVPKWGQEFYTWISDVTPIVIAKLGNLLDSIAIELGKIGGKFAEQLPQILAALAQITTAVVAYITVTFIPAVVKALANLNVAIIKALSEIAAGLGKAFADMLHLPDIFGPLISNARILADIITGVLVVAFEALIVKQMTLIGLKIWDTFETLYLQALYAADGVKALIVAIQTFISVKLVDYAETAYLQILYLGDAFLAGVVKIQAFIVASGGIGGVLLRATTAVQSFVIANGGIAGLAAAAGPWAILIGLIGAAGYAVLNMNDKFKFSSQEVQNFVTMAQTNLPLVVKTLGDLNKMGGDSKEAFRQIAEQSTSTATEIINNLDAQGKNTDAYKAILQDVIGKHKEEGDVAQTAGQQAKNAFDSASDAASKLKSNMDILLGRVNDVKTATANYDLAINSLNETVDRNASSSDSDAVKQANLQLAFNQVYNSVGDVIAQIEKHGGATDEDRAKVSAMIDELERDKSLHPEQAAALQIVIDKLYSLANAPETHINNTVTTTYNEVQGNVVGVRSPGGQGVNVEAVGGVIGYYALEQGGLVHAAMGAITGFKTKGPTLVGEGNPTYPEYVIATDPAYRDRNVKLLGQAGHALNLFADGGILGNFIPNFSNWKQVKAMEALMQQIPAPVAATPVDDKYGFVSSMQDAMSQVKNAIGNFQGVPGYIPSASMILQGMGDATTNVSGMLYGNGPGSINALQQGPGYGIDAMSDPNFAGFAGTGFGMSATPTVPTSTSTSSNDATVHVDQIVIQESNDPNKTQAAVYKAFEDLMHNSKMRRG